jgi:hypothetical protein
VIATSDLRGIAKARLLDAQVLLRAKRFDGAFYLCGYSVELALKARICRTLKWSGFPQSGTEFQGLQSVKTHDLEVLPEKRYQAIGQSTQQQAADMLTCAKRLLAVL